VSRQLQLYSELRHRVLAGEGWSEAQLQDFEALKKSYFYSLVLGVKLSRSHQGQQITRDIRSLYEDAQSVPFRTTILCASRWRARTRLTRKRACACVSAYALHLIGEWPHWIEEQFPPLPQQQVASTALVNTPDVSSSDDSAATATGDGSSMAPESSRINEQLYWSSYGMM